MLKWGQVGFSCLPPFFYFNGKVWKMKSIEAKKSGRWAQKDPAKKQVVMIKGNIYDEKDVPVHMMEYLVGKDFAEFVTKGEELTGIHKTIAAVIAGGANKNDQKDLLETWALKELEIDIDKRKSLDFLVELVAAEYELENG